MDPNQMIIRHWEDVVFENRNKSYGAYMLRRAYSQHVLSGLMVTLLLIATVLSLRQLQQNDPAKPEILPPLTERVITITHPPSFDKPPQRSVVQPPKRDVQNQSIVVTTEEVVEAETITELAAFSSTEEGTVAGVAGVPEGAGVFSLPEPEVAIEPAVREFAEVMPYYEGGEEAMMRFIQRKIRYPRVPKELGIDGTVYVRFIVRGDGTVSDVEILRGVHRDYDREAIRVISMLPAWKGGSHNGRPVSVRMVLPIKFNLK